jgi:hypothetical protein
LQRRRLFKNRRGGLTWWFCWLVNFLLCVLVCSCVPSSIMSIMRDEHHAMPCHAMPFLANFPFIVWYQWLLLYMCASSAHPLRPYSVCFNSQSCQFCPAWNDRNILYQFKKRNKFHLILNLSPFQIFQLNSARNVPVSFHIFRSALEKPLNQIEPCSI